MCMNEICFNTITITIVPCRCVLCAHLRSFFNFCLIKRASSGLRFFSDCGCGPVFELVPRLEAHHSLTISDPLSAPIFALSIWSLVSVMLSWILSLCLCLGVPSFWWTQCWALTIADGPALWRAYLEEYRWENSSFMSPSWTSWRRSVTWHLSGFVKNTRRQSVDPRQATVRSRSCRRARSEHVAQSCPLLAIVYADVPVPRRKQGSKVLNGFGPVPDVFSFGLVRDPCPAL